MITKHLRSISTAIPGVTQIKRFLFTDTRGSFTRLSDLENLRRLGWQGEVMQINHSVTKKAGTVRGMHYQNPPYTEYKLVNCIKGSVYDVVVDLREGSSTFLRSVAVKLSPDNSTAHSARLRAWFSKFGRRFRIALCAFYAVYRFIRRRYESVRPCLWHSMAVAHRQYVRKRQKPPDDYQQIQRYSN